MAKSKEQRAKSRYIWLLAISYWLLAAPALAQVSADVEGLALSTADPRTIVANIIRIALGFLGVVALALILYGGFMYMTAAGNEERIEKARKILVNAVIGLAIILSAFAITQFILSRLQEATRGPGVVTTAGEGGAGGGLPADAFVVRGITPAGAIPIRNAVVRVVFNKRPSGTQENLQNIIVARKVGGERVSGVYTLRGSTVEFRPEASCPEPNQDRKCFEADTDYTVVAQPTLRSADNKTLSCGGLAPACSGEFRTGNLIDVAPPVVRIEAPDPGQSVQVDTCVPVQARVTDDAGISSVEFFEDGMLVEDGTITPAGGTSPREAILELPCWPTAPPAPQEHTLTARAYDVDDNNATSPGVRVMVRPAWCFNGALDEDLGETGLDCGGDCGACDGGSCTQDIECRGGLCVNGQCATPMTITGVSPGDGRAGTFVILAGLQFCRELAPDRRSCVEGSGTVDFAPGVSATAPAACSGALTWSNNYVLVGVPEGAQTGPVTVSQAGCVPGDPLCRDSTNDERGPIIPIHPPPQDSETPSGAFEVNDTVRPGLCSVNSPPDNLPQGGWGMLVNLQGAQFGQTPGQVLFGGVPGLGVANWSDTGAQTAVPPIAYGRAQVQVRDSANVLSNALPYDILSPDAGTLPEILSITPDSGGSGQGITITGRNFGTNIGLVQFRASDASQFEGVPPLQEQCSSTWWMPTAITVRVPGSAPQGNYEVYIIRCGSSPNPKICDNAQSNRRDFTIDNTPAGPFLACVLPLGGPAFTNFSIYGENLGGSVTAPRGLYLTHRDSLSALAYNADGSVNTSWSGTLSTLTNIGGVRGETCPANGWSGTEVCAQVAQESKTGQILAEQDLQGVTRRSNPLSFSVGSCLAQPGDPLYLACQSGTQCCGDGSCNIECPEVVNPEGAYGWQFTTSAAPIVPRVLEQCDSVVGEDHPTFPPSPAPWATSGRALGSAACVNAAVNVVLNTPVVPSTLTRDTVKIEQCTGAAAFIIGNNANFAPDTSVWGPPPDPTPDPDAANTCRGVNGVCERHLMAELVQGAGRDAASADDPGNYALRLTKLDDDTGPGWPNALGIQRNYEHWFGYEAALDLDTNGKSYTVSAYLRAGSQTAIGKRAGILIQRNNSVGGDADEPGFWQKSVQEVTLTDGWQKVEASINFDSGPNSSGLGFVRIFVEGLPYDIRAPEPEPNLLELFSVLVDDVEVQGDACTEVQPVSGGNFEVYSNNSGFRFWPVTTWAQNAWYRVTLLGGEGGITAADAGGRVGEPMPPLQDAQTRCGDQNAGYCFRFKTQASPDLCEVGGIAVVPNPWTARAQDELIDYTAFPVAQDDPCLPLSPQGYAWTWASSSPAHATVSFSTGAIGHLCSDNADCAIVSTQGACVDNSCASMPWTTTATALEDTEGEVVQITAGIEDQEAAGNGQLFIEFAPPRVVSWWPACGEACRNAGIGARFSIAMLDTADSASVTNPANVALWAVPCGNGIVDPGEDCDDGNNQDGDGCSSQCLNEGSNYAMQCGNGRLDPGEDCDDGNIQDGDGCSKRCLNEGVAGAWGITLDSLGFLRLMAGSGTLISGVCGDGARQWVASGLGEECDDGNNRDGDGCSARCLREGTRSDLAVCGNGRLERGEECEANFGGSFADWCDEDTCLRQGPVQALSCGNGRIDDGEECDPNSPLLNTAEKRALCTGSCLWTGTLPPQRVGGQGCGNSRIEIGEDCDDGNRRPGDGCSEICLNEGSIPLGTIPICGDGIRQDGEDCDDGNLIDGDGCSSQCLNEGRSSAVCGNGVVDPGEDCDTALTPLTCGAPTSANPCLNLGTDPVVCGEVNPPASCTTRPNTCGNGRLDDGEDCDGGPYCSARCLNEGRSPQEVQTSAPSYDTETRELAITPQAGGTGVDEDGNLNVNTFYRVLLRDGASGMRSCRGAGCATAGKALDPGSLNFFYDWDSGGTPPAAFDGSQPANTFSWTFKTNDTTCDIDRVEVTPPDITLYVIGARQSYSSAPYGPPDACSAQGQRLNPLSYAWGWATENVNVAAIVGGVPGVDVIPSCGNGRRERGEDCDDGNLINGDGCSATCLNEGSSFTFACGNGVLQTGVGEECELPGTAFCSVSCQNLGTLPCASPTGQFCCGNGVKELYEDCDDGNTTPGDGCSPRCLNEGTTTQTGLCGNGTIDDGEECDPEDTDTGPYCNAQTCLFRGTRPASSCGNGIVEWGEDCDDGNVRSGDGCAGFGAPRPPCTNEGSPAGGSVCGNRRVERGEDCDDGNTVNGDGCSGNCLNEGALSVTLAGSNPNQPNAGVDPYQFARAAGILKFCRNPDSAGAAFTSTACVDDSGCSDGQICMPPNPWTTTEVQAVAQGKVGVTPLTVFCGAGSEADCPAPGAGPNNAIGRGTDTCCYARPAVAERLPASGAQGVCRNGLLRASFDQRMDPQSLLQNIALARAYPEADGCAAGTRQLQSDGTLGPVVEPDDTSMTAPRGIFARVWNWFRGALGRLLPGVSAQADPVVWCVDPALRLSPVHGVLEVAGQSRSIVTLQPSRLLGEPNDEVRYRVALVGDRELGDAVQEGLRSIFGVSFFGVDQSWWFEVSKDICTLDQVEVTGGTAFQSSGEIAATEAFAYTRQRSPPQIIQPTEGYSWEWSWGAADSEIASVTSRTEPRCGGVLYGETSNCADGLNLSAVIKAEQSVTAGSKNGTTQVNAKATITEDFARPQSDQGGECITRTVDGVPQSRCSNHNNVSCTANQDCGAHVGASVIGTAEFTTFLCDNPWPAARSLQYLYTDKEDSPLGGGSPMNFQTQYCRDGQTLLPELGYPGAVLIASEDLAIASSHPTPTRLKEYLSTAQTFTPEETVGSLQGSALERSSSASVASGGGNASASFDDGKANFDYQFTFPQDGDYELEIETSNFTADLSNLGRVLDEKGVSVAARAALSDAGEADKLSGAWYHRFEVSLNSGSGFVPVGMLVNRASGPSGNHAKGRIVLPRVENGDHTVRVRWINPERLPAVASEGFSEGEIWTSNVRVYNLTLRRGRVSDSAVGIRVMSNPARLPLRAWYDQMGFAGSPSVLPQGVDGYEALRDGNTIYVGATNVIVNDDATRTVYGNVYLISYSQGAPAEISNIFEQLVQNLAFNVNLEETRMCEDNFCSNDSTRLSSLGCADDGAAVQKGCDADLQCAPDGSVVCNADKTKLKRDLLRVGHLALMENALAAYEQNAGRYPTLPAGSFIRGMSNSRWPSWATTLGNDLGLPLPQDPINIFAAGCEGTIGGIGAFDTNTCYNELAQTYRCPQGSHIYQYRSRGPDAYILSAEFELLERAAPAPSWTLFGWNRPPNIETSNVCQWSPSSSRQSVWSNADPQCGNGVLEDGETCELGRLQSRLVNLSGELRCSGDPAVTCASRGVGNGESCGEDAQENSLGTCRALTSCTALRQCNASCTDWAPWEGAGSDPTAADCIAGGTFCGNGVRDPGEDCDDGLLNGQYGKCKSDCSGLGNYCGDGTPNTPTHADSALRGPEVCDEGALNGTYGHCRFDCTGFGAQCGDNVVQTPPEQCEVGQTQISGRICFGLTGSEPDMGKPCENNSECETSRCYFPDRLSGGSPSQNFNDAGYPLVWRRACLDACRWPTVGAGFAWQVTAQGECGNGTKEGSEQCDDGNQVNEDGCTNECRLAVCNDGIDQGLVCTAGAQALDSQGARRACVSNNDCGAGGVCSDLEECDLGAQNGAVCVAPYNGTCSYCDRQCNVTNLSGGFCGDTLLQAPPEQCEGNQGFSDSASNLLFVCQGQPGVNERFWGFEKDGDILDDTNASANERNRWFRGNATVTRVSGGYHTLTALQITAGATCGSSESERCEARLRFQDTNDKRYKLSAWVNTLQSGNPKVWLQMDRFDATTGQGDVVRESAQLALDNDPNTWQYLELTMNYDNGPLRTYDGIARIRVSPAGTVVQVDKVHLQPAESPVCDGGTCGRICKGGTVCRNNLYRCEGGTNPGAACTPSGGQCQGGGSCAESNFDEQDRYLWPVPSGTFVQCPQGQDCSWRTYKAVPTLGLALRSDYVAADRIANQCDTDKDNDGYPAGPAGSGLDCDDNNALANPDRPEICNNGWDDNCNGEIDECVPVSVNLTDNQGRDDTFCLYADGELQDYAYGNAGRTVTIPELAIGDHQIKVLFHHQDVASLTNRGTYQVTFSDNVMVTNSPGAPVAGGVAAGDWFCVKGSSDRLGDDGCNLRGSTAAARNAWCFESGTYDSSMLGACAYRSSALDYDSFTRIGWGYLKRPAQNSDAEPNPPTTMTAAQVCSSDNGTPTQWGMSGAGQVVYDINVTGPPSGSSGSADGDTCELDRDCPGGCYCWEFTGTCVRSATEEC
ncbi:DUF4215 domain-containing protein [Candidatus Uhrbacteria bacterium]|nr:DUF4215 domain-containing protein [Candidatus Uhrbacteria bacterium]